MRKTRRPRCLTCGPSALCGKSIPTMLGRLALGLLLLVAALPACPASYYPQRLEDARAVYVAGPSGGDDTAALQQAIDRVRDTGGQGIVLLGPGRYRINDTLYIWPGIRVIGYGATRPVIVLSADTPGFQEPTREKVMVFFAGGRPVPGAAAPATRREAGLPFPTPTRAPFIPRSPTPTSRSRTETRGRWPYAHTTLSTAFSPTWTSASGRHWLASTRRAT